MEEGSGGVGDGGEFGEGLDDAGLVVAVHDADERGVGADGGGEGGGLDDALGVAGEECDFYGCSVNASFAMDWAAWRTASCSMLEVMRWGGVARRVVEDSEEGEVVAFGAAGGEDDLGGEAVEEAGDGLAGAFDGGAGVAARLMDGAGVAEVLDPEGTHGVEDLRE